MKVFKFGGASVKDADAVKNVASILSLFSNEPVVVVISAMGKTTNALEKVVQAYYYKNADLAEAIKTVKEYHHTILKGLGFRDGHRIYSELENSFTEIAWVTEEATAKGYAYVYDQIVSQGELISTK